MSNEEFKKNIKTISNNDLLEQVEFMSDGYYFELVEVCLDELRCRLEATRWHYPSKGEYPTEDGRYLVVLKSKITGNTHTTLQDYYTREGVFGDYDKRYFEISDVVAWMPLPEPPKEEER